MAFGAAHRLSFGILITSTMVLPPSGARAQLTTLAHAPEPAPAGHAGVGVLPRMPTELTKEGWCAAEANGTTPSDPLQAQMAAHKACLDTLIPKRPVPVLQTPGSFFAGYAWGSKSNQFVYGPQVGIGAAVLVPLRRPSLKYILAPSVGASGTARRWVFALPPDMTFAADIVVSLSANLAAFRFPNADVATPDDTPRPSEAADGKSQHGVNTSLYFGPQAGWQWWDGGAKRVMFSLGLMAGHIDTAATGSAFVLGVQPGVVAQF